MVRGPIQNEPGCPKDLLPMTADEPMPPYPLYALTTYELKDYRSQLERALGDREIGQAPIAADIREKLGAVLTEQEQRENIRHGRRKGTHSL
jgi:hypothetical protein